jgi:UDP-glucose 4-epimerase
LVTGGAGFIGSHLVERLLGEGFKVRILDDFSSGREENLYNVAKSVEIFRGDIRNNEVVDKAVSGVDAVIHLAAKIDVDESFKDPMLYHEVNVGGTLNLLNSCVREAVKKFLYVSTCAVYGNPLKLPVGEEHPANPLSPYAASKLAAEAYCKAYTNIFNLNLVILRLFNVYGPRQFRNPYAGVILRFIENLKSGRPLVIFGDGEQTRDFTFVEDAVEAMTRLIVSENIKNETFNLGSGRPISINQLANILMRVMNVKGLKPIHTNPRPGDIRHSQADISKIARAINFKPKTPLEEGLRLTLQGD